MQETCNSICFLYMAVMNLSPLHAVLCIGLKPFQAAVVMNSLPC